ncbi:TolB/tetratricopeptide repeat domain-containing protein (plasmid) [Rhizobium gallicum]|uniref:TolB/tetratricopeptide repeat domain-containing protein n=1 Tax=Rhizobium gallicum TaxID=56730 RepID=A0A1L5NWG8_9HYPH|nr:tetratricopeptide repeat protein [Rhizobium gallicum]APO72263.1 TolB/tetratricopeptide repeat domain-containing protein [Rhizobium gallicum]
MRPPEVVCREQISRIQQSVDFHATEREHRFLEYVVEESLSGRGERIKAYSVAVEVFGRDTTFDPQNDPIVRIAAKHLRRSLERYYLTAGLADPVVVAIPKGGYVPTFSMRIPREGIASVAAVEENPTQPFSLEQTEASNIRASGPPSSDDVRGQLQRIVSSPEFPKVGRAGAFLSYIVEEALAGRGHRIKGYSIAIEVFKRPESFTQDDPVVRIEAGTLRRALERYYLVAGRKDPLRIDIPKGGYVPTFAWNEDTPPEPVKSEAAPPPEASGRPAATLWRVRWPVLGALIVVAGLVGSAYWLPERHMPLLDRPTLVVAPFANLGDGPNAELYAQGLTEELLTALPRFKEIKVFGRETSASLPPGVSVSRIKDELVARYLLNGSMRTAGSRIRVTARLLDTLDGSILWSEDYENDLQTRDLFAIQMAVANKVAATIAQPYGIMAQVVSAKPPPDDRGAYDCTLNFYTYRAELSVERHADVRACLERVVARYPSYATAWAMLSILYLDEERFKFNSRTDAPQPMQRALQAARRAIQLDPDNTRGLQALMTALFFNQQFAEAMRIGEQALATNPNDTELMGELGTRLAMGGQWQRGVALLDKALALNPGAAGYYHGTRALAAFMLGDYPAAVAGIRRADLQKFSLFHIVAAIIYAEAGMSEEARREGETFMKMRPDFVPNIAAELRIRNIQPRDQLRLIMTIRKAGMPVPDGVEAAIADQNAAPGAPPR